jgi:3-oxoacyl-[acyl-carrier-protein] synthase II
MTRAQDARGDAAIAVTGMSVLTPLGDSLDLLTQALSAGRCSVEPAADLPSVGESRLRDFDATRYANVRGMRVYNRTTQLGICATRLALNDAGLEGTALDAQQLGIVTASTFAHMDTLLEYDRGLITVGVQRTNPTLMPLGLPSAPGAAIALAFGAKAFSVTLSDGAAAGLAALGLAARLLGSGRARACVVVSAFTLCKELVISAAGSGILAPAGEFRVLDQRARGTAFGEAATAVVLERFDHARERGVAPKGYMRGHAATFATSPTELDDALGRACKNALRLSRVEPAQIGLLSTGANGIPDVDRAEGRALSAALGDSAKHPPVTALKGNLGDSMDASGLLQSVLAWATLRSRIAPPIARFEQPAVPGLHYPTRETSVESTHALVTSTSHLGACSALVLSAHHDA